MNFYSSVLSGNLLLCTAALLVIWLSRLCLRYWKYRRSFDHFPTYYSEKKYITLWALGKIPKDISFTAYFFREAVSVMKNFTEEGICVLWGFKPIIFPLNEEYTKILSNERATADKTPVVYTILQEMVGKGLVTTNGDVWKEKRKMLNPAFRFDILKGNLPMMNEGARIVVKHLAKLAQSQQPTAEVANVLKLGSLKILCGSVLGIEVNDAQYDSKMRRYLELLHILAAYTMYRVPRFWLYWKTSNLLFPTGWKHRKLYEEFHEFTNTLVKKMMESYSMRRRSSKDVETLGSGKMFVELLLEKHMEDPTFTIEKVQDEVTAIIFGGHDTSAYTLLWCIYLMGLYPEVQRRAYEEAEAVLENKSEYSYSDLPKLTYLECVIKETLRLYPTVPMFGRYTDQDIQCGKYLIPAGTIIGFAPYMLQRNPRYFPEPEKFDPDRFASNDIIPWTYIPFSEGMRSCIGKKYAMLVMKVVLAHILRNFEITSLDRREDVQFDWDILLTPSKPLRFHLTPRHSQVLPQG